MKEFFSTLSSVGYFILVMSWLIPLLLFLPFGIITDINTVRVSGFSGQNTGISFIAVLGALIGFSMLIPAFRKMYYKLPWLFPYVKIFFINVVIISVASMIINYGYEIQNETRHTIFFILMLCEIVIGRILMCLYFSRKKIGHIQGGTNG
jgi:hypothetical protein